MENQADDQLDQLTRLHIQGTLPRPAYDAAVTRLRSTTHPHHDNTVAAMIRMLDLAASLPFPLAIIIQEYAIEANPFVKLHRLTDAAELLTRFIAIVLLSDLLRQHHEFPLTLRQVLLEKIERPTFGAWKDLVGVACQEYKRDCFVRELPTFTTSHLLPALGNNEGDFEREIIPLRNLLAHQGRITDTSAMQLLSVHETPFESLLASLSFMSGYDLLASDAYGRAVSFRGLLQQGSAPTDDLAPEVKQLLRPERVILVRDSSGLDLFPLLVFGNPMLGRSERLEQTTTPCLQLYLRLNRKGRLEYTSLADEAALSQRNGHALQRFHELYNLDQWRRLTRDDLERRQLAFDELVDALSDVFVGRDEEVAYIKKRVKSVSNGLFWLSGKPGIGKSALMARLTRDYRGATQHYIIIPYFFRAGHAGCSVVQFIRTALLHFSKALNEPVDADLDPETMRIQFIEMAKGVSSITDKKILFLIDGVDEIQRIDAGFLGLLITAQAPSIVWLCAGRDEAGISDSLLRDGASPLFAEGLPPMGEQAILSMLTSKLDRMKYELFNRDRLADGNYHNPFVEALVEKSEGLPLYVHIAIEDLRSRKWSVNDEYKFPHGLEAYFDRLLERLRVSDIGSVITPLFCLLAWAKEPIGGPMLHLLLSRHHLMTDPQWSDLVQQAINQGHLMFRDAPTPEGNSGLTFYHDSFRSYLLATADLERNRAWALRTWLDYCAQWRSLPQGNLLNYPLRHYPEHLHEAKQWPELFDLARDVEFPNAQNKSLPDNPELALNTLSSALLAAAEVENAELIAEFLISRSTSVLTMVRETPLDALRAGRLKRAYVIADLSDLPNCSIWYLILAWELIETGKIELAKETLDRLLGKNIFELSGTEGEVVLELLLSLIGEVSVDIFAELVSRLLTQNGREHLFNRLASLGKLTSSLIILSTLKEGWRCAPLSKVAELYAQGGDTGRAEYYFQEAIAEIQKNDDEPFQVKMLSAVAEAQVRSGNRQAAKKTFSLAFQIARSYRYVPDVVIEDRGDDAEYILAAWHLEELANAQARAGEPSAALETANEIKPHSRLKASALVEIARHYAKGKRWELVDQLTGEASEIYKADKTSRAFDSVRTVAGIFADEEQYKTAFRLAASIVNPWDRALTLRDIASAQKRTGQTDAAAETVTVAIQCALEIQNSQSRGSALWFIAELQAEMADFTAALDTIGHIDHPEFQIRALKSVALVQARAGSKGAARSHLKKGLKIALVGNEIKYFLEDLADAFVQIGDYRNAIRTIEQTMDPPSIAKVLKNVARANIQIGKFAQSRNYFAKMIESTEAINLDGLRAGALIEIAKVQGQGGTVKVTKTRSRP